MNGASSAQRLVRIPSGKQELDGNLTIPDGAGGLVLFAHGSGSSRLSPRNRYVAGELHRYGLATLLMDLLTPEEEREEAETRHHRFNIELLGERLLHAADWVRGDSETGALDVGYFGASTGAAAALVAAAQRPEVTKAVVSRGGRPDLAGDHLPPVEAPTLLIVGGDDGPVITLNEGALRRLKCPKEMVIVPGASHLFEEPGTLEEVARLACLWFERHLGSARRTLAA
jgi:putative phosphoribosyl transferase